MFLYAFSQSSYQPIVPRLNHFVLIRRLIVPTSLPDSGSVDPPSVTYSAPSPLSTGRCGLGGYDRVTPMAAGVGRGRRAGRQLLTQTSPAAWPG